MPPFVRQSAARWHAEVPGSRWCRADLHLHTLDDHPNGNLQRPPGVTGAVDDPATLIAYARAYLKAAIANNIQVLGLTPHAVRIGTDASMSATWAIVDEWNSGSDDDGVPFRDKIYAVFPGFEPSLNDGSAGIHLIFLFDPEIGKDQFLRAFDVVMNGVEPYRDGGLLCTTLNAAEVFHKLRELVRASQATWRHICLAPHAFSDKGLFKLRSQVLQNFPHQELVGIELGDNQLPADAARARSWLEEGIKKYRHCLYHSSDAYSVDRIGHRHTMVKLGSPRIESLRQAFLAGESRVRLAFQSGTGATLIPRTDLPDPLSANRPWLRKAVVKGGTSFFRQASGTPPAEVGNTFELSPDLTCIIGGRMCGKSTLLDGLRVHLGAPLPTEVATRADVESRGRTRFLSGNATCDLDICGPIASTEQAATRWPAKFFTQRELQDAVKDQAARRRLLYRLVPGQGEVLERLDARIASLDTALADEVVRLVEAKSTFVACGQELQDVERARTALARFSNAGAASLSTAQGDQGKLQASSEQLAHMGQSLGSVLTDSLRATLPALEDQALDASLQGDARTGAAALLRRYQVALRLASILRGRLERSMRRVEQEARAVVAERKAEVQRRLVAAGGSADDLNQFDALSQIAADFESRQAAYQRAKSSYAASLRNFASQVSERNAKTDERRRLMATLAEAIGNRFAGSIRLVIRENGVYESLNEWIRALRNQGVTRWWNERCKQEPPVSPQRLYAAWRTERGHAVVGSGTGGLADLGMSAQVAASFKSSMTDANQYGLAALRSEDKYNVELRVSDAPVEYKEMAKLSGGAQVSVLLSLVLEGEDSTPLVIDQPEDEIDKGSLLATVLPALRRLKGKRQVILATHDANIVVNGDADQVIQLKAEAESGRIEVQGVIERADVRDAIVNTLDGGQDAFALRQAKYGF